MGKRFVALITGLGCAVAATAGATAVASPDASAAKAKADVLVEGHVYSTVPGEGAVADGATVFVSWTSPLSGASVGSSSPIIPLGSATVEDDGSFSLAVQPTKDMRTAAKLNGGWLNFDVAVVDPSSGKLVTATLSRELTDNGWAKPEVNRAAQRTLQAQTRAQRGFARGAVVDPEDPTVPAARAPELDLVVTPASPDASQADLQATARSATVARGDTPMTCKWVTDATPTRWDKIIEFHNASNSDASWSYGKTAGSDIDVAYSGQGDGWGVKGSNMVSNSMGSKIGWSTENRVNSYARTQMDWRDQHTEWQYHSAGDSCAYLPGTKVGDRRKTSFGWVGGVDMEASSGSEFLGCSNSPQSDHRTSYPVNSYLVRDENSAAKISGAVDVGPITIGSDTDYSTHMSQRWDAKRGNGIWLCGTNYYPPSAGVIHAENRG